ncbi:MAG: dethiobiotin synthase [Rhodopirellula sp.]|nr:dethiobiotin synthase [Rhodopirellula sp.]
MRGLFITGTDTNVGKTYVTSIILRELISAGVSTGVSKPACSGAVIDGDTCRWPDLEILSAAAQVTDIDLICSQRYRAPLAPPVAARQEGRQVDLKAMKANLLAWSTRAEVVIVEGVGGLLCPLTSQESAADFAGWTGFPLIIVARLGLGTINHTLLTIEAARHRNLAIAGIVLNDGDGLSETPAGQSNYDELTARTDIPVLGVVGLGSQTACLRDGETPARIDWSELAASRDV